MRVVIVSDEKDSFKKEDFVDKSAGSAQDDDYIEIKVPVDKKESEDDSNAVDSSEEKFSNLGSGNDSHNDNISSSDNNSSNEGSAQNDSSVQKKFHSTKSTKKSAKKSSKTSSRKRVVKKPAKKKSVKSINKKTVKAVPKSKARSKKKRSKNLNWLWWLLIIIGLGVIAVVVISSFNHSFLSNIKDGVTSVFSSNQTSDSSVVSDQVAVLVNGKPIYVSEVNELYDQLPEVVKAQVSKDAIIDRLVDQELLVQEAEKKGVVISDKDINDFIIQFKLLNGFNDSSFEQALADRNLDMDSFKEQVKKQLLINYLLNSTVFNNISVSDDEALKYYNNNEDFFKKPEAVLVRHILLTKKDNESADDFLARAKLIKSMINPDFSNFCDLVTNYSQDPGSIANCGSYNVSKDGKFVPEFEDAAFSMSINDTELVNTSYGIHIVWKVAHYDDGLVPFDEVKDQIINFLKQEKSNIALRNYLSSLRDNAVIELYPDENALNNSETSPSSAIAEENEEENLKVDVKKPEDSDDRAVENDAVSEDSDSESHSDSGTVDEGSQSNSQLSFSECLSEKNVVMYGVSWSPDVASQKKLLGDSFSSITYVDCDPASGEVPAACDDISVFPTFEIGSGSNVKKLVGKQSINALALATGCNP